MPPGDYVLLEIKDTGHGMDVATQQRIFEPFYTTKTRDQGTGLGLSTVFGIVKQHGGGISVCSKKNQGTTFEIYLPKTITLGLAKNNINQTEEIENNKFNGSEMICIVEDNTAVRHLTESMLTPYGYEVITSGDPKLALELALSLKNPIQLLLSDVVMPGMNGPELYNAISQTYPHVKVVFMSGYTNNLLLQKFPLTKIAFIQKPFTQAELLKIIRATLDG